MKIAVALTLLVFTLGFGALLWIVLLPTPSTQTPAQSTAPIIDEWMEEVQAVQFDSNGQIKQILTVKEWQHQQGAQTAEWQKPHLSLPDKEGVWSLSAQHGTSTQRTLWGYIDEMHLSHNIIIQHTTAAQTSDWLLKTEYLLLLPEKRLAHTTLPVWVEGPWLHMQSQGLDADFNTDKIEFVNTVHSRYTLPPRSSDAKI